MRIAAHLVRTLKNWITSRPGLEIEESATWFLLLFAYAHGLTTDGLGFKMEGTMPQITIPQVTFVMALFCLTVSVVILAEPVLPSKIRTWTKGVRTCSLGQYLRGISILFAFILGMAAGFSLLRDNVPTMSWIMEPVAYVGFSIFVLLGIKLVVSAWIAGLDAARSGDDSSRG